MNTLEEIVEQLKRLDELTLLEMLNISSEELVERCRDLIEEDPDRFELELQQWNDDDNEED